MPDEPSKIDLISRPAALNRPADKAYYADAMHCNRCGFCTSFCPTYLATGDEGLSPRGRNQAFRAVLEGRLADPAEAEKLFSTCLLCGICTSVCFSEVPTAKLMVAAREKITEKHGQPLFLKFVLRVLLPRPKVFEPFLKILFIGKRLGVSRWMNRAGLLRMISPKLADAEELAEEVPSTFLRDRLGDATPPPDAEIIQFVACGSNFIMPQVGEATARIIRSAGFKSGCADNVCCGMPGVSYGDLDAARAMARKNIVELEKYPKAIILVDDSSCSSTIKEYPQLFDGEPDWLRRAETVSRRTRDLSEWFLEKGLRSPALEQNNKVTYHDPCKARYAQKIVDPPRQILARSANIDYRELPEAEQCCGGGGTYSFVHPEISRAVLDRKTKNILSTGADYVLTSSISCLLQVRFGLRRAKSKIKTLHLAEYLSPRTKQ